MKQAKRKAPGWRSRGDSKNILNNRPIVTSNADIHCRFPKTKRLEYYIDTLYKIALARILETGSTEGVLELLWKINVEEFDSAVRRDSLQIILEQADIVARIGRFRHE